MLKVQRYTHLRMKKVRLFCDETSTLLQRKHMILKMVLFSADTKSKGLDHCVPQLWTGCGINMAQYERIRLALGHQSHSHLWNLILVSYCIHKDIIHPG